MPGTVLVISFEYLLAYMGYFTLLPVLTLLLIKQRGLSVAQTATAALILTLATRSGKFFAGPYLDGLRPKVSMFLGMSLAGVSLIGLGFVHSYAVLLGGLILVGLGVSANGLAAKSLVSHLGSQRNESLLYFSNINVFVNISAAAGPWLGSYLLGTSFNQYLFQFTGLFFLASALVVLLVPRDSADTYVRNTTLWSGYWEVLTDRAFMRFLLFNAVGWFCYSQLFTGLPFFVATYYKMENRLGGLYTLNAVMIIFLQLAVSAAMKRWLPESKAKYRLLVAYALFGLAFAIAGAYPSFYLLFATVAVFTVAEMIFTPSVDTMVSALAKPELRITYFSVIGISTAIGESSGSYLGVRLLNLWEQLNMARYFWFSITLITLLASLGLYWMLVQEEKRRSQSEEGLSVEA